MSWAYAQHKYFFCLCFLNKLIKCFCFLNKTKKNCFLCSTYVFIVNWKQIEIIMRNTNTIYAKYKQKINANLSFDFVRFSTFIAFFIFQLFNIHSSWTQHISFLTFKRTIAIECNIFNAWLFLNIIMINSSWFRFEHRIYWTWY